MNPRRLIYFLLLILLLSSCQQFGDAESGVQPSQETEAVYEPEWSPPAVTVSWLPYEVHASSEINEQVAPEEITAEEIEVVIERDTINGISVRAPQKIILPAEDIILNKQESIAEAFYSISYISTNNYFGVTFDNDIFTNTDYYYTNGIRFELIAPIFAVSPFAWPMLPYSKESMNYHGMSIIQNMYTPTNPDTISVIDGDRPFAAYLYLGHFKHTLSKKKRYRQFSEVILGLIGPGSLGGVVQGQIHNIEPVGWQNQIQNDLVLNYTVQFEKGIINPPHFDLNVFAEGQVGTLYDNIGAGINMRAGWLNPYFSMPNLSTAGAIESKDAVNLQFGLLARSKIRLVGYDATLQGGVLNPNNNYTIPDENIERIVLNASAGIYFAYKQLGITLEINYVSPEFKNAMDHRWGHINVMYCF